MRGSIWEEKNTTIRKISQDSEEKNPVALKFMQVGLSLGDVSMIEPFDECFCVWAMAVEMLKLLRIL